MPTRNDIQSLLEWCDAEDPIGFTRRNLGAALGVHEVTSTGDPTPPAVALCLGSLHMSSINVSELPDETARFFGTVVGIRNPTRELTINMDANNDHIDVRITGPLVPAEWGPSQAPAHVRNENGAIVLDWELFPAADSGDNPLFFELALWTTLTLGVNVHVGPP